MVLKYLGLWSYVKSRLLSRHNFRGGYEMYSMKYFPRVNLASKLGAKASENYSQSDLLTELNQLALIVCDNECPEMLSIVQCQLVVVVNDTKPESLIRPLAQILLAHHLMPDTIRANKQVLEIEIEIFSEAFKIPIVV